jgi:hypothetical protein
VPRGDFCRRSIGPHLKTFVLPTECYAKGAHLQCVNIVAIAKIAANEEDILKQLCAPQVVCMQLFVVEYFGNLRLVESQLSYKVCVSVQSTRIMQCVFFILY